MKLKYFLRLAYPSFNLKNLRQYFTIIFIIRGFFIAAALSLFIYLSYFNIQNPLINTVLAFLAFFSILKAKRETLFFAGFFTGILWFYWIGFSFRYYDISYLIPLMILAAGLIYGFLFWILGIFENPFIRAFLLTLFSFIHPLGFNWFIPEISLTYSFIGIYKWQFFLFLISLASLIEFKKYYKLFFIPLFILSLDIFYPKEIKPPLLKIYLSNPSLSQEIKWKREYLPLIIKENIEEIKKGIKDEYDMIILSESIFPLYLNKEENLFEKLKDLSKKIVIVTGALSWRENKPYNSTYYFINGKAKIVNKVVLVPFGEEIPLPKFISKYINKIFFNGASDYATAKEPSDIKIKGYLFRNAICYEATREELYKNHPNYMIAISNNAWFTPSIEPHLQNLLLKYFAKKYNMLIFHSANMGITEVIKPKHYLPSIKKLF